MALFNFFSSKSSNATPTSATNLVVFDLDALESKNVDWAFLETFEKPELWIFTSNKENPRIKEWEAKYSVKIYPLPQDTRQSPFWVLGVSLSDFQSIKDPKSITLIATLPYYEAVAEYLNKKGIPMKFVLVEAKIPKPSISSQATSSTKTSTQSNASTETQKETEKKTSSKTKKKSIIKALDQQELQKICDAFQEHFELEGIYEKKALSEIVKIATGKIVQKVFHTRNAKLYVGCLYHHGIIENVNENDFKLLRYPTPDIFPKEVTVIRKKKSKKATKS